MAFGKGKRHFKRYTVNLQGEIEVLGRPILLCVVGNLSEGGALVELIDRAYLPKFFALRLGGVKIECEMLRQSTNGFAVRFRQGTGSLDQAAKRMVQEALQRGIATRRAPV